MSEQNFDEINTDSQEYKDRYIKRMTGEGLTREMAVANFLGRKEVCDIEHFGNPELDAEESLTYYID